MRLTSLSLCLTVLTQLALASPVVINPRQSMGIDQETYNRLERYAKFCVAALQVCPRPMGTSLVKTLDHKLGTEGFITRDDQAKEVIVAFRGTDEEIDIVLDVLFVMLPLVSPGLKNVGGAWAHTGFQVAYNAVAKDVIATVKNEIAAHPGYKLTVTGHSLGGAVASIGALSLKAALPDTPLQLYTYGQPRVGNQDFKNLVENRIGVDNVFRASSCLDSISLAVHTNGRYFTNLSVSVCFIVALIDGIATLVPKVLGFRHFGTEYWQFQDPGNGTDEVTSWSVTNVLIATSENTRKCVGSEDPTCSATVRA
ncbi:lipase [Coprinopsis sp. MPI-PUGE-AT-0042]|nr:lipase [Coprinopsis sp. MPI-PUGE-AT-0042]